MVTKISDLKTSSYLHNCLKVRATASIFKTRFVRNLATKINSEGLSLFCNVKPEPSLSLRERLFQDFARLSMSKEKKLKNKCFPRSREEKKHPTNSKGRPATSRGQKHFQERREHQFYSLREEGHAKSFLATEKPHPPYIYIYFYIEYEFSCVA